MDHARFKASLTAPRPAAGLTPPLVALWWEAKGDWKQAHETAQSGDDQIHAWVHAYLHRVEGDLGNAGYWYRQAGKSPATGSLKVEWDALVAALLPA